MVRVHYYHIYLYIFLFNFGRDLSLELSFFTYNPYKAALKLSNPWFNESRLFIYTQLYKITYNYYCKRYCNGPYGV